MLKNHAVFIQEFLSSFKTTGSLCPTSRWSAHAMVYPLNERPADSGWKILELGPGTGSVTKWILRSMNFKDSLTVCEINSRFMQSLKDNLSADPYFRTHQSRINFHCCPMQELPENESYDFIVCAIPFLNLNVELIQEIFLKIKALTHQNSIMTFYQYVGLRRVCKRISTPNNMNRLQSVDLAIQFIMRNHLCRKSKVWANFPPITVFTLNNLISLDRTFAEFQGSQQN